VLAGMRAHLDEPEVSKPVDPLCFVVRGWVWLESKQADVVAVEAFSGKTPLGETAALYLRRDVNAALSLDGDIRTGFELFAHQPATSPGGTFELSVHARLGDGSRVTIATRAVTTIARDYRRNDFGVLLDQRTTAVHRRASIYNEGPSVLGGSGEVDDLLRRYLGPPPLRLIDVGCGLGYYGRGLLADGYDWMGAEVDAADCAELARAGLPHRQVDGRTLPFPDGAFDAACCIEVLEHIDEPHGFLREVRRVAPRRLLVSVPNCELLGYLHDHLAAPWHMLEPDHKNFFTRWSLGALLREHYSHVEVRFHTTYPLRTAEGLPLHYNLFAVASSPA
jgi:SAM-dependent methyltransferase